ncbi:topoisomerase DNA-binding C4 zinc finger domain-containing protein [Acholeplasma laidlawii]|uniref:topoisomerase DNA-binding C4 zinc finger domain-containing protein n=1 Tax=Acholeplasma laidlawii TaxID=2148 RepID=UPI0021F710BB|nr:topoisomerase DNA-binding C4 zinc finger domain-containing protein [Acholeplasma laidlawii]
MGAWLIEFISNIVNITGNALVDTIIFSVIGIISASVSFGLVGALFQLTGKYNSKDMSDMHWGLRVIIFVILTFVLVKIAEFIRWLLVPPALYYLIAFAVVAVIGVVLLLIFKKPVDEIRIEEIKGTENKEAINQNTNFKELDRFDESKCPYCGGLLVDRKGPYGKFTGCSNYPECKYTSKR